MEGMYREDMYQTAMGYGLVTPAPEVRRNSPIMVHYMLSFSLLQFQDRSLATGPGMDIGVSTIKCSMPLSSGLHVAVSPLVWQLAHDMVCVLCCAGCWNSDGR